MNSKLALEFYHLLKGDTIMHGNWIRAASTWQQACKRHRSNITERSAALVPISAQKNNLSMHGGTLCIFL